MLVRVYLVDIADDFPRQRIKALVLQQHDRTDSHDAKHMLQCFHRSIVIVFAFHLYIDSALLLADMERAVHFL